MNGKVQRQKVVPRDLLVGVAISLSVTVIARLLNVIYTEISGSSSVIVNILDSVVFIFDSIIYAAGAALIVHFLRRGNKRYIRWSFFFILFILALDYTASFVIDLLGNNIIGGLEMFGVIYLILNFAARAMTYLLIAWFAPIVTRRASADDGRIPIISLRHPVGRLTLTAALLHMAPYLLFEIYSNITGIVEYGFPTNGADILSILSAYGEILLIDGALTYFTVYVVLVILSLAAGEKKAGDGMPS